MTLNHLVMLRLLSYMPEITPGNFPSHNPHDHQYAEHTKMAQPDEGARESATRTSQRTAGYWRCPDWTGRRDVVP